jgi:hypothetical protein
MPRPLATALLLATLAAPASALPPCGPPETVWDACVGEYRFEDGATYVGEVRDWMAHGSGTATLLNGETYVGDFRDGKFSGRGTYFFQSGATYVGDWRDDKRHGQGTYTFPDGAAYVGEFRDDKLHGRGTLYAPDGRVLRQGVWIDGRFAYPF